MGRSLFESPSNSSNNASEELFFVVEADLGSKNSTCVMVYLTELVYFELSDNATEISHWSWSSNATTDTVVAVDGLWYEFTV